MRMGIGARVLLGALSFAFVAAAAIAAYGLWSRPGHAEVAIVFGNTVRRDGTPSPRLVARLEEGRRLYRECRARILFVSGGMGREGHDESRVMRDWLVAHLVPDSAVVRDSLGLTSQRTAENARRWMAAHRTRRAIVVTQYFHVARAMLACRAAGIELEGASAPRYIELRDAYSLARELVALPVYALRLSALPRSRAATARAPNPAASSPD